MKDGDHLKKNMCNYQKQKKTHSQLESLKNGLSGLPFLKFALSALMRLNTGLGCWEGDWSEMWGGWAYKDVSFLRKLKPPNKTKGGILWLFFVSELLLYKSLVCGFLYCVCGSYSLRGSQGAAGDRKQGYGTVRASEFLSTPCFVGILPVRYVIHGSQRVLLA